MCEEQGAHGKISIPSAQFFCKPKIALKIQSPQKQNKNLFKFQIKILRL